MEKIAFLGLGIMGTNICTNLLKAGYPVTAWNRTARRLNPVVKAGAQKAASPKEAVQDADIVILMLSDDKAVESVVFGQNGVLEGVRPGQIVLDMTTVSPRTSLKEAAAFNEKEVEFLDAPTFGSRNESRDAGLWVVVGGKRRTFDKVLPMLKKISESQHYMGPNGKGSSMKLVGNLLVSMQLEAIGEALVLAQKAGLDPKDVLDVVHRTDFKSPIFDSVGDALARRDFSPNFYLKLMLKDANLIAGLAQELNSPIPAAAAVREVMKGAVNKGLGDQNAHALIRNLEEQAGVEVKYRD